MIAFAFFAKFNEHLTVLDFRFVQSQGNPATDPVILWLNGGPGQCFALFMYLSNNF